MTVRFTFPGGSIVHSDMLHTPSRGDLVKMGNTYRRVERIIFDIDVNEVYIDLGEVM
jgi:hypothetical protein